MNERSIEILRELDSRPSSPFFEYKVAQYIVETIKQMGVKVECDRFGNIIAHYDNFPSHRERDPIAFVAHMDHPGFEITESYREGFIARAMGGIPVASLKKPTPVVVFTPRGERVAGEISPIDTMLRQEIPERMVYLKLQSEVVSTFPIPVVFDLPDFSLDGDTIRMRALDDLAGCASILVALEWLVLNEEKVDFYAVFTRAEEVGLIGARLLAYEEILPKETIIVSVESSPVIPGISQGEGPVIRTGDASYTFDSEAEKFLSIGRLRIQEMNTAFKYQRHLMRGGTCEATAFAHFGYRVTGIAFPLGNYHNATTKISDASGGVDLEYIDVSDYLGGIELIMQSAIGVSRIGNYNASSWVTDISENIRSRMATTAKVFDELNT